jgi:integrase
LGDIIKRHGGYTLRFYESGRRKTLASKQPTYGDARRMLLQIEARVARGEAGITARRAAFPTVAELIEEFLQHYSRPKLKDPEKYRAHARTLLLRHTAPLLSLRADQAQPADIAKLRDALLRKHAPGSVKNILAQLSTMFLWAVKRELAPHNPCQPVEKPIATPGLDFLSRPEVATLLDAAAQQSSRPGRMLHVAIALAVHTGLRKGELFGLRWTDLDLDTRRLTVARSYRTTPKNGRVRHLRLPRSLVPLLREWHERCPKSKEGSVLPLGSGDSGVGSRNAMLGLPRLMAKIGLRAVLHPWHLLRHTMASHFVMQGGNILALQKILGHSDVKMTMLYAHLAPDFLGDELDRLKY